jgi:ribosomal protein S21
VFVQARPGESFEELYRRFTRGMEAGGVLREYRKKQRFVPAHEARRDKIRAAKRRAAKLAAKLAAREG